jgi:hypothetical protein
VSHTLQKYTTTPLSTLSFTVLQQQRGGVSASNYWIPVLYPEISKKRLAPKLLPLL